MTEQLTGLAMGLLAGVLTLVGFVAESAAFENLAAGQQVIGVWEIVVGTLLLVAGAKLVRDEAVPRLMAITDG
ncbi:conserved hypothetical protein [Halorhabdus tiamatea SARL4B]|uniref:DUF8151 domain-containing protein n=1 Tax=Halorhabdus tiamatea SARL4B TaxID=1033806 RepID=S6D8W7_9EURY|nr:conserved hypothetical protein [Halorhabdus tiamatea SARL4B]